MKKSWRELTHMGLVLAALAVVSVACSTVAPTSTPVPQPTVTPLPTATTLPTATPLPTAAPLPTSTPLPTERILVTVVEPVRRVLESKNYEVRNCETTIDVHKVRSEEFPMQEAIVLGAQATATQGGSEVAFAADAQALLVSEIKSAYRETLDSAAAWLDREEFVIPVGKIMVWQIEWEEQQFVSTVSCQMNGVEYTIPYTYTLTAPNITIARSMSCTA